MPPIDCAPDEADHADLAAKAPIGFASGKN
jgi:hypothetical protein